MRTTVIRALQWAIVMLLAGVPAALAAQQVPQILYYKFNESTGTSTLNEAMPGQGSATAAFSTTAPPAWVTPGKLGASAITLAGNQQGFATGWAPSLTTADSWTIECWLRKSNTTQSYLCGAGSGTAANFRVYQISGGLLWTGLGGNQNTAYHTTTITTWGNGTWHHLAGVYDAVAGTFTVYVNGVQDLVIVRTCSIAEPVFTVGGRYPTDTLEWSGDIDDFRVWNVARTAAEISANYNQELVAGPMLTGSATAGTAAMVLSNAQGAGGAGVASGKFAIASNSQSPAATLDNIQISASGTGNDAAAFTEVAIYRDNPLSGTQDVFDPADTLASNATVFPSDNGSINFAVVPAEQGFNPSETHTFFIVTKLAGVALPGQTFMFTLSDMTVSNGFKNVPAGAIMNGLTIDTPVFSVADASSTSVVQVPLAGSEVCQAFTIAYPAGPDDKPGSITVSSLGNANEATDLVNAQLWYDTDDNGAFNDTTDTLINTQTFTQDNGTVIFSMASHADFTQGQTRRFFVVYNLNTSASHAETFKCYISDVGAGALGGVANGLPAPGTGGTAGLEVSAGVLIATLNGPAAATSVDSNAQGPSGEGLILCDVTLFAAPGGAWTVSSLTFNAAGTGNHNGAYSELALFETGGAAWTTRAAATQSAPNATSFTGNAATFALTNTAFAPGATRRFFLLGKLNGTAIQTETYNARLESIVGTPPPNGGPVGIPTADSTALVINSAALTVANGTPQPNAATHKGGVAAGYTLARFLLSAVNDNVTITGVNLTTGGTGTWSTDVDNVQVFEDDGDGVFGASDTLLFQGAGAAVITATFTTPLIMPVTSTTELWVRVNLSATAGIGATATPETFNLSIAAITDVNASTPVILGTPLPASATVGAIEFEVASFTPPNDLPGGGKAIVITGKGFMSPFTVTIGGAVCPGTALITLNGTNVTGLTVPGGSGQGLPIVITSGTLAPQTITQTFSYGKVSDIGGTGGDSGGGGCSTGGKHGWLMLALLPALAAIRRRSNRA